MMTTTDKALTALMRSMKRALKQAHGIEVPHSALRASYLSAQGEHPHAFSSKHTDDEELSTLRELVAEVPSLFQLTEDFAGRKATWLKRAGLTAPTKPALEGSSTHVTRTLYLVEDDLGCLTQLSLAANGSAVITDPTIWDWSDARLLSQVAEVPSVKRYGLPSYLQNPREFYQKHFGLAVAESYTSRYEDLGDDSGDRCRLTVSIPVKLWQAFIDQALQLKGDFHQRVLRFANDRAGLSLDTLEAARKISIADWFLEVRLPVVFEWGYPDEDGSWVEAVLDLDTGTVTLKDDVPEDIDDSLVRTRIWVADPGDYAEVHQGSTYESQYVWISGDPIWKISDTALTEIQQVHGYIAQ
jgi:hypothetical protein